MTAYEEKIRRDLVHSVLDINEEKRVLEQLCAETNGIYGDRHAYLYETNSIAMMVLFRMFTGLSNRECCALRWKDIQEHPSYGFKNIFVTKYMADAQTIKNYVSEEKRNKIRYIPIVKPIADMLEARESYIHKKYNIPYEQIQEMPMFFTDAALEKTSENKNIFLEPKKTAQTIRKYFEFLNDEEFKIVFPSESKKEGTETDLRTYYGDIIYSNFKSKLKMPKIKFK